MKNNSKKAQITLFIIIGVVLILSSATFYLIYSKQIEAPFNEKRESAIEISYSGSSEIQKYVESCLRPIVLQGLEIIRLQGGFIYLPNTPFLGVKDYEQSRVVSTDPMTRNIRVITGEQNNKVPFWLTNNAYEVPPLSEIENQLKMYVDDELNKCVGELDSFIEQGFNVNKGNVNSTVTMAKSVIVEVDFPITITKEDQKFYNSKYLEKIPINFKLIHSLAENITLHELFTEYFETFTKNQIILYGWIGGERQDYLNSLPPFSFADSGFSCTDVTWRVNDVKRKFKDILNSNLKSVKVNGTNFIQEIRDNPLEQGAVNMYIRDIFNSDYPNIKIDFSYDKEWGFYNFDILPNNNGVLKPDRHSLGSIPMVPTICSYRYSFKYSVEYPILVRIKDDASSHIDPIGNIYLEEEGYTFQFPMWIVIIGNQPRAYIASRNETNLDISQEEVEEAQNSYQSMFCDNNQRLAKDITINTIDSITNELIMGVDIYYKCGSEINNCFIAKTNSDGTIITDFPTCEHGTIYTSKLNYSRYQKVISTRQENSPYTIELFPESYKTIKVIAKTIHIPSFMRNYFETDNFTIVGSVIRIAEESNYDMNNLINTANNLNLDLSDAPWIKLLARNNPFNYCSNISLLSEELGIEIEIGEPLNLRDDDEDIPYCPIGSYEKTENKIIEILTNKLESNESYQELISIGMKSFLLGIKDIDIDDLSKNTLINLEGSEVISLSYQSNDSLVLPSGEYKISSIMSESINASDTNYGNQRVRGIEGVYITGSMNYMINITQQKLHEGDNITFFIPVNFYPEEIDDMKNIDDPIIRNNEEANLNAELLYKYKTISQRTFGSGDDRITIPICSNRTYDLVLIDGINSDYDPFENNILTPELIERIERGYRPDEPIGCNIVKYATISKENYFKYANPIID